MKPNLQEPPIEEQMGLPDERRSRKFKKGRLVRRHERPELCNAKIKDYGVLELWITPYNRFFLVDAQTGDVGYPSLLATGIIHFEPSLEGVPEEIQKAICALLERQRYLRQQLVKDGEYDDGESWEWS